MKDKTVLLIGIGIMVLTILSIIVIDIVAEKKAEENQATRVLVKTIIVSVGPELVDCANEALGNKCMEVDGSPFHREIEGFEYEEGYTYELRINQGKIENVIEGESSVGYYLTEVVSKEAA
jgi:hypothetical protein